MTEALRDLERVLHDRRERSPAGSYSAELLADGERLQRKIIEEAFEVCLELGRDVTDRQRVAEEAADLVFHLMVGLTRAGVALADVERVLEERRR